MTTFVTTEGTFLKVFMTFIASCHLKTIFALFGRKHSNDIKKAILGLAQLNRTFIAVMVSYYPSAIPS